MKYLLFISSLFLAFTMKAEDRLTATYANNLLTISLQNTSVFATLQTDIVLPENITAKAKQMVGTTTRYEVNPTGRIASGFTVSATMVNGNLRVTAYPDRNTTVIGTSATPSSILTIPLEGVPASNFYLKNNLFTTNTREEITLPAATAQAACLSGLAHFIRRMNAQDAKAQKSKLPAILNVLLTK
ncbi:MAG: hypothetical protein KBT12_03130 [Bacteroidales bacterium]|nr:hypothetical protein [Candidatus Physcousia equi]